jgi:NTE family protein
VPGARLESLLDPTPLSATVREHVDFVQIERNVRAGALDGAAVVATSALTSRSVVFHCGLESPPPDRRRGIDYVRTPLAEQHVLASAAIPAIFPAVHVNRPRAARGWYVDGGTRLDTPIKPALKFGARRVIVIALNSLARGPARLAGEQQPDALDGTGQILTSVLDDQLTADIQTLSTINGLTRTTRVVPGRKRRVPYIVIAPATRDAIAKRARRVLREHYSGLLDAVRSPDIALLSRLIAGGSDAHHAELLSFVLFASEFTKALVALGKQDAQRWIDQPHEVDDLWQLAPIQG